MKIQFDVTCTTIQFWLKCLDVCYIAVARYVTDYDPLFAGNPPHPEITRHQVLEALVKLTQVLQKAIGETK